MSIVDTQFSPSKPGQHGGKNLRPAAELVSCTCLVDQYQLSTRPGSSSAQNITPPMEVIE